ncbi:IPExxxVDY family protein [Flagellimonas sp.]|uniref:IPExxxVDY family protein n=1 Tax=Flagellimonas sp. TaxID=2058762 RepID=UPI003B5B8D1A
MSTTHKISADFYDDDFQLIAIHSDLEDYAIGYAINSNCGLYLKRLEKDLLFNQNLSFSVFEWDDEMNDTYWTLISNKCAIQVDIPSDGLFEKNTSFRTDYLIKEQKEVDYFLKVDAGDEITLEQQIKSINKIPKVITAYPIDVQTLKSKRNLIF